MPGDTLHWVDGVAAAALPVDDRGLAYGDGLFETMACRDGRVRFLDLHLDRLQTGFARLGFAPLDETALRRELATAAAAAPASAVIKVIVTRGSGGRGYVTPDPMAARRIVSVHAPPALEPEAAGPGVRVRWCDLRLAEQPRLAGLKHLNRLEQVLARAEWKDPAIAEGLLCDAYGNVICGTRTNVFCREGSRWLTPSVDRCGVAGVMRRALLGFAAEQGIAVDVGALPRQRLLQSDEAWLSNAVLGVWPVRELGGRSFETTTVAQRLQHWVEQQ